MIQNKYCFALSRKYRRTLRSVRLPSAFSRVRVRYEYGRDTCAKRDLARQSKRQRGLVTEGRDKRDREEEACCFYFHSKWRRPWRGHVIPSCTYWLGHPPTSYRFSCSLVTIPLHAGSPPFFLLFFFSISINVCLWVTKGRRLWQFMSLIALGVFFFYVPFRNDTASISILLNFY